MPPRPSFSTREKNASRASGLRRDGSRVPPRLASAKSCQRRRFCWQAVWYFLTAATRASCRVGGR
eukprot:10431651-Alexandrium_andersonii.AAC.1